MHHHLLLKCFDPCTHKYHVHEVVHFMEVSYKYMYVHVCILHAWGKGLATQQNSWHCAFVPCINIQIKIGSEEGYVHIHTHTHTQHVSAYEVGSWNPIASIVLFRLHSDWQKQRIMSSMIPSSMSLEVMEATAAFYQLASWFAASLSCPVLAILYMCSLYVFKLLMT